MVLGIISLIVVAYVPGALIYRLPFGKRSSRMALPFEERVFWAVTISVAVTTLVALGLTGPGWFALRRVVVADLIVAAAAFAAGARRLTQPAAKPNAFALLPLIPIVIGLFLFFPPAEYVMGGKDPGTYINEGIQIARHGSWTIPDKTLALIPPETRSLFVSPDSEQINEGTTFMGFFVLDADRGTVVGQFPHGYPVWIAMGYDLGGVAGALSAVGVWGLLGVLAVYFASARLLGRLPALVGSVLLAINVAEVWFARYPNSEMMQQALLFAGLLALARSVEDDDAVFGVAAGLLFGAQLFTRIDTLLFLLAIGGGVLLLVADGKRPRWWFWLPLAALTGAAAVYYLGPMWYYASTPLASLRGPVGLLAATAVLCAAGFGIHAVARRWPGQVAWCRLWLPRVLAVAVVIAFAYGYFWRAPQDTVHDYAAGVTLRQGVAANDAYSLRQYAWYVGTVGLLSAVLGLAVVTWRSFWRDPVLLTAVIALSGFFFYKTRIVPEHFWLARRYLAIILPMTCVMSAAGAMLGVQAWWRRRAEVRPGSRVRLWPALCCAAAGTAFVCWLGWQYASATAAIVDHVEYAGLTSQLEALGSRFGERDLVLVESRNSSDAHVLATPLAYTYGRHVLQVLHPRPDRVLFDRFCRWAVGTYAHVYFVADGGTDIRPTGIAITPVASQSFSLPEYESALNAYPRGIRQKKFSLSVFLLSRTLGPIVKTEIDVGTLDDVWVLRFYAKEREGDVSFRWSGRMSFVSLMGVPADCTGITLTMSNGGRPARAGTARVEAYLNDQLIGAADVTEGFHDYTIPVPPDIAARAAATPGASVLRLMSTTWSPKEWIGGADNRQLGVMLDRVHVQTGSVTTVLQIADARERRLVAVADALLRVAGALRARRTRPSSGQIRRVLVLRLERIGDLMMSLPALHAIRTRAPQACIRLVTGSWNAPLAHCIEGIDEVETLDASWLSRGAGGLGLAAMASRAWSWRRRRDDLAINLEGDIRSNLLLRLSGAAWTAGFDMAGGGPVLDEAVPFTLAAHTATNGVALVAAAFGEPLASPPMRAGTARDVAAALPRAALRLPADAHQRAARLLGGVARPASPMVGIQVGAGRLLKQWPAERMAAVAEKLAFDFNATIVLTGADDDRALADHVRARLPASAAVVDAVGTIDLVTLAAVLDRLSLLITPDTGPMHLAAVLDTPVVAVFGPSSPERWGPLARQCRIVRVDLPCSPCNRIRRPPPRCLGHTPDCLAGIQVDDVCRAAASLLRPEGTNASPYLCIEGLQDVPATEVAPQ